MPKLSQNSQRIPSKHNFYSLCIFMEQNLVIFHNETFDTYIKFYRPFILATEWIYKVHLYNLYQKFNFNVLFKGISTITSFIIRYQKGDIIEAATRNIKDSIGFLFFAEVISLKQGLKQALKMNLNDFLVEGGSLLVINLP